jgi:hypothetical protein
MTTRPDPQVLVIGAGPVGLVGPTDRSIPRDRRPRFSLNDGGRVVIRPDSDIGAIATLHDTTTIADYFATVRS